MAGNSTQTLMIQIAGQCSGSLQSAVKAAQNALGGLGGGLTAFANRAVTGGVAAVAGAIGAATTAMGTFAAASVKTGLEFDKAMSNVAATMGKPVSEINDLRELAIKMGNDTAFSAAEAAEALNYMALAGYDAATSTKMLPNVLNLAAAGGIELGLASDMVTDAQSALGLSIGQTTVLVDQMAKAASSANADVAQMGEAILTVGGTAKYLSGGTVELNTVLGVLADNSIKGAEGGTALRNIMLRLSAPTAAAQKTLNSLGVSAFDAEGKMRSFADFFPELNASLSKLTDQEKKAALANIFNVYDQSAAEALLGTSVERWEQLSGAIENSAGAAQQMAETKLDNLAGDITRFQSALGTAQIRLAEHFTPALREFAQIGTAGLTSVTKALENDGLIGAVQAAAKVLPQLVNKAMEYIPDMIDAGTALLEALFDGIGQQSQLATSVAKIVAKLAQSFIKIAPKMIVAGGKLLAGLVRGLIDNLPAIGQAAREAVMYFITAIRNGFTSGDPFKSVVTAIGTGLAVALGGIFAVSRFRSLFGMFGGGGSGGGIVGGITQTLVGTGGGLNIAATLKTIGSVSLVIGAITGLSAGLGWLANNADGFKENLRAGAEIAKSIGEFLGNLVGGVIGGIAGTAAEVFTKHLPAIAKSLSSFAAGMKPFFSNIQSMDMSKMGTFASSLAQMLLIIAGNDVITAIRSFFGGGDNLGALATQLGGFADKMGPTFNKLAAFNQTGVDNAPKVFGSLAALNGLQFTSGGFFELFTGKLDLTNVASQLSSFADNAAPAFNKLAAVNETGLEKTPKVFASLALIGNYEFKSDGVAQFFTGRVNIVGVAEQLSSFADYAGPAFNKLAAVNVTGLEKTPKIFESLSRIGGYEFKSNGVAQLFSGSVDIVGIATQLSSFADTVGPAFNKLAAVNVAGADNASKMFEALQKLGGYELKSGGLAQLFSGGLDLAGIGEQFAAFASKVAGIGDISNFNTFVTTLTSFETAIPSIDHGTNAFNNFKGALDGTIPVIDHANNAFKNFSTAAQQSCMQAVNSAKNCATGIDSAFKGVNLQSAGENMMRGLIAGINSMREQVLNTAKEIAQAAATAVNSALKIKSPSRVMMKIGAYISEGLALGMEGGANRVTQGANAGLVTPALQAIREPSNDWISKTLNTLQGGGDTSTTYNETQAPTINCNFNYTFNGAAPSKQDLSEAAKMTQSEFEKMVDRYFSDKRRMTMGVYRPGY